MLTEEVKKTTAAIYKNGTFTGSAIIFRSKGKLYCITAAHNMYGLKLNEEADVGELSIEDYLGFQHKVLAIHGDKQISIKHDISLLSLEDNGSTNDFIIPIFASIPQGKTSPLFLRGHYGAKKTPVNRDEIYFDEKQGSVPFHFFCDIDKQKLANHVFAYGSDWLSGSSGSGLFYDKKNDVICCGILLEIPDKGDNGKLMFCAIDALRELGFEPRILSSAIFDLNTDQLSEDWFKQKMDESILALGPRYTPTLHFELPIAKIFNGLSRNIQFKQELDSFFDEVYKKRRSCYSSFNETVLSTIIAGPEQDLDELKRIYLSLDINGIDKINYKVFIDLCTAVSGKLHNCINVLFDEQEKREKANPTPRHTTKPFHNSIYELHELQRAIRSFSHILQSTASVLSNEPSVILKGEAGFGKSHLLADIVSKRYKEGKLSLLLLGQHLVTRENPWYQILHTLLRVPCDEYTFLSLLNAKAELSGSRIVIFIDAINEGNGKVIWKDHLQSFIQSVRRFPWLGIVFSVRTTYHSILVRSSIYSDNLATAITHYGFAELEYEAADYFFDNYGIKKPGIPFLHPEFRSPLFLKLFCDGLKAKGLSRIPPGYNGITAVLNFFLNGINEKLSIEFNYPRINLVKKVVQALAQHIASSGAVYMPVEKAFYFFNSHPDLQLIENPGMFIDSLIHEGVLSKNMYYREHDEPEEGIYFSYERFFDHLVAANLIEDIGENPMKHFNLKGRLYSYFKDEETCFNNLGLIDALSVQIPEKYDLEFFDLVPHVYHCRPVAEAFVKSIIWRKNDSFVEKSVLDSIWKKFAVWWKSVRTGYPKGSKIKRLHDYLQFVVLDEHKLDDMFLYNIMLISSVPGHMFNADFLHVRFMLQTMAERDASLLPWLTEQYHDGTVSRLIDWGWKDERKENISDDSILLSCTVLSWFLISSNRPLRDSTTKAIICLLQYRPHLLIPLLRKFADVNDPYVYERLIGVSYGCTLRAEQFSFLPDLCSYLFTTVFDKATVYPHLLMRDYAKGVIEFATNKGVSLSFDFSRAFPPYQSEPITSLLSNAEIDIRYKLDHHSSSYAYYQNEILTSMTTEYGRGTSSYGDFGRYVFERALSNWDVNADELSNYAVQRIFEMGYDVEMHGEYDRNGRHNRESKHNERIGKKYQWIAFMEVLARVADHATMYDGSDYRKETPKSYLGAWQPNVRDIDLSMVIRKTMATDNDSWETDNPWWIDISSMDFNITNREWMHKEIDIPKIGGLVTVRDSNGYDWVSLELMLNMGEEKKVGEDPYDAPHKRIYLQLRSYLLAEEDFEKFKKFGETAKFYGRWMPESSHKRGLLSREYYWSRAYEYNQAPYYGGNGDEDVYSRNGGKFIAKVHIPVEEFMWEEEFDLSKEETITFYRPSERLWQGLGLQFGHLEGEYTNGAGETVCKDPSVNAPGPSCLLVRKDAFINFLAVNHYKIGWTILGEKQILSAKHTGADDDPRMNHKISGFYWMDGDRVSGSTRSEIKTF
jgi:hypothetical protein